MAGIDSVLDLPQQSPSQWGARKNYDGWNASGPKDGVTVHYVGPGAAQAVVLPDHGRCAGHIRGIENYHINSNGWSGIGYSFVICPHGVLHRARGAARGAHNPGDSDGDGTPDNVDSIGVLVLLSEGETPVTDALQMLQRVCDAMGGWVAPHSKDRATSCPGDALRAWVINYKRGTLPPNSEDNEMLDRNSPNSDAINVFQKALMEWSVDALPRFGADSDFGGETEEWVKRYQTAAGIPATGTIGGVTAALLSRYASVTASSTHSHKGFAKIEHIDSRLKAHAANPDAHHA